jgi:hypothetical protein
MSKSMPPIDVKMHLDPIQILPLDVGVDLGVIASAGVTMTLLGDPARPVSAAITVRGDKANPLSMALDASMQLKNLPNFTVQDIENLLDRMKPRMRLRMPFHFNFGVSVFPLNLFGVDALQFSLCGEPQVIVQDYTPNAYERCEVDCDPCDPCEA